MNRQYLTLVLFLAGIVLVGAQDLTITQVDPAALLLNQTVDLYLHLSDVHGADQIDTDTFRVSESVDGERFTDVRVVDAIADANRVDGLTFLLLIDNSGSMYDTVAGSPTENQVDMRVTKAKEAVNAFLAAVTNPRDAIGLASFNTGYVLHTAPTTEHDKLARRLDEIERPTSEQAYTELYAGLISAVDEMGAPGGRKVLIVLSDGENFPYRVHANKPHPVHGDRIYEYTEPIDAAQREGISVFAVNFGARKDSNLETIALETGGAVYDAADGEELRSVYLAIREQVLQEVRLTYRPTMTPAERKWVRVEYGAPGRSLSDNRFYYSSTLFGLPMEPLTPLLLIPFFLAVLGLVLLSLLKLERRSTEANLEILGRGPGTPSTRILGLGAGKTVIGGSEKADLTIADSPKVQSTHATVVYDKAKKSYTLVADASVTVNHQNVEKTRILEAGDVIDVGGTTIIFDDDVEKPK